MAWREMTEHELAGLPEARLGGALLWMVTAAAILCIGALIGSPPIVAAVGFLAWIAYRFAVALLSHAGWPLMVDLLGEAVLAAGFCGYMADGVRPNAYYRRRLPAP